MKKQPNRLDLIFNTLQENKKSGKEPELVNNVQPDEQQTALTFENLDLDSIKPKKLAIEYASVKVRADLYDEIKKLAKKQGINQPGKLISLVLEAYVEQAKKKQTKK